MINLEEDYIYCVYDYIKHKSPDIDDCSYCEGFIGHTACGSCIANCRYSKCEWLDKCEAYKKYGKEIREFDRRMRDDQI